MVNVVEKLRMWVKKLIRPYSEKSIDELKDDRSKLVRRFYVFLLLDLLLVWFLAYVIADISKIVVKLNDTSDIFIFLTLIIVVLIIFLHISNRLREVAHSIDRCYNTVDLFIYLKENINKYDIKNNGEDEKNGRNEIESSNRDHIN